MKIRLLRFLDFILYWSIVAVPFAIAIAPGLANTFIAVFCISFILVKLLKKESLFKNTKILVSFSLLVIVSLLSFVNSVSLSTSMHGITKLLKFLLIFVVCGEGIEDKRHLKRIVFSICCGTSLLAIDAFWQSFFGFDFVRGAALHHQIGLPRASASFPNPNLLGIYMSSFTPLVAGLAILYFKGRKQLFMAFLSILALAGLFLSLSRGAGLAAYLAILFLAISG